MANEDLGSLNVKLTADIADLEQKLAQARAAAASTAAAMAQSANQASAAYQGVASSVNQANSASRSFGLGGGGSGSFGSRGGVPRPSPFPSQGQAASTTTWVGGLTAKLGPLVNSLREASKYAGIGLGLLARASAVLGVVSAAAYALGRSINYIWASMQSGETIAAAFKNTLDLSDATGAAAEYQKKIKDLSKTVNDIYNKRENEPSIFKFLPWNVISDYFTVRDTMKEIQAINDDFGKSALRLQIAQQQKVEKAKRETEELRKQLGLLKDIQEQQRGRYGLSDVVFSINANTNILKDIAARIK